MAAGGVAVGGAGRGTGEAEAGGGGGPAVAPGRVGAAQGRCGGRVDPGGPATGPAVGGGLVGARADAVTSGALGAPGRRRRMTGVRGLLRTAAGRRPRPAVRCGAGLGAVGPVQPGRVAGPQRVRTLGGRGGPLLGERAARVDTVPPGTSGGELVETVAVATPAGTGLVGAVLRARGPGTDPARCALGLTVSGAVPGRHPVLQRGAEQPLLLVTARSTTGGRRVLGGPPPTGALGNIAAAIPPGAGPAVVGELGEGHASRLRHRSVTTG
ncbi:hypothetical protein WY02_24040 [Pseudonocardia sp. AL041005-10]|nr:hypothetical protein WY02_24040 [Pseudonocardia sp. AL041005-10]